MEMCKMEYADVSFIPMNLIHACMHVVKEFRATADAVLESAFLAPKPQRYKLI